jgi:hypothetical protein
MSNVAKSVGQDNVDMIALKKAQAKARRKEREQVMRSLGLVKVRGAVSGRTYWE